MTGVHDVSILALAPFILLLGAVAILPLFVPRFWDSHTNKLAVAVGLSIPVVIYLFSAHLDRHLWHTLLFDYLPFVILLGSLFAITGGISVTGDIEATPLINTTFLAAGAVLASLISTTGASMLLIRPLLQTNKERVLKVHTVLFFIGIVANCGGLLTPLGDPPLFVLYLRGVPFDWFILRLWPHWLLTNAVLLLVYFAVDSYCHRREPASAIARDAAEIIPIEIRGKRNIFMLLGVVLAVAILNQQFIGLIRTNHWVGFIREAAILLMAGLSLLMTPRVARTVNNFNWGPIQEVAYLFFGIFVTMVPCTLYLEANAKLFGITSAAHFYYAAGSLSAVLDNTPTAVTFYALAVGLQQHAAEMVAAVPAALMKGITAGAVFFGSMTYIGNGPNFMVKAIAEENGIEMPHFFRYIWVFSLPVLLPAFLLTQLLLL